MLNIISLGILVLLAGLLIWWSVRAAQFKSRFLKWLSAGLGVLVAIVVSAASVLAAIGLVKANARTAPVPVLDIAGSPDQVRRGQAISDSFCSACHSVTGTLTGGLDIGKDFPLPVGSFVSANLTPAGRLKHWSDGEIFRAIRNGVDADGHWLTLMSYTNAGKLSDADILSLIAYLRSLPAAGEESVMPADQFNLLGLIMLGAGLLPTGKPVFTGTVIAPPKGPTLEWGAYLLSYQDCRECHGATLTGGVPGQMAPLGPDLNLVKQWKPEEFISTLRTGVDPGSHILSAQMPWRPIGRMDDDDLHAIYQYLTHMPDDADTPIN
ncbi:MAG TPA: c-type cytochrome [Dongiaceae bacterium]|nr:c-type cytochrome [Dongiaceae bacterium]